MTEQVLDDMKRMLDFCPNTGLQMLQLLGHSSQFILGQRLAFGALHVHMPRHRFTAIFGPLFHTLVAGVAERGTLAAVQQRVRLRHVGDIASRADDRMHQARSRIDADVGLHAKVPVIAFLRLVHLGIALAVLVLRRRRRGDQRGVDDGAFAHHQALLGEVSVDRVENLARESFGFKQVAELQQGRRVRRRLPAQINADKGANGLAVIDRVFDAFIDKPKHCWATYMRNMRASPIGGRPAPSTFG